MMLGMESFVAVEEEHDALLVEMPMTAAAVNRQGARPRSRNGGLKLIRPFRGREMAT